MLSRIVINFIQQPLNNKQTVKFCLKLSMLETSGAGPCLIHAAFKRHYMIHTKLPFSGFFEWKFENFPTLFSLVLRQFYQLLYVLKLFAPIFKTFFTFYGTHCIFFVLFRHIFKLNYLIFMKRKGVCLIFYVSI